MLVKMWYHVSMSQNETEFSLESKVSEFLSTCPAEDVTHALAVMFACHVVPNDILMDLCEKHNLDTPTYEQIKEVQMVNNFKFSTEDGNIYGNIYHAQQLQELLEEISLVSEEIDFRYEYHIRPTDSFLKLENSEADEYDVHLSEELGLIVHDNIVVSRTSQPLLIRENDDTTGYTSVNAIMVMPLEFIDTLSEDYQSAFGNKMVLTPSYCGGFVYEFRGQFKTLNVYACDVLGIPVIDGDVGILPLDVDPEMLMVFDPVTKSDVPMFIPDSFVPDVDM
jgi:hypothetical protein